MNAPGTCFEAHPALLGAFVRAVATAGDSPTIINRVASNATYVDLCRRIVALDPTVEPPALLAEACRRADITSSRLRARLNPVARALNLAPSGSNASYYQILGVSPDSDTEAIRRAYRRRARDLHPDRSPKQPADHLAFTELTAAYRTLSDPVAKKAYDARLAVENTWYEPTPHSSATTRRLGTRLGVIAGVVLLLVAAALVLDQLDRARSGFDAPRSASNIVFRMVTPPVRPAGNASPAADLHPKQTSPPTVAADRPTEKQASPDPRLLAALLATPALPPILPTDETATPEEDRATPASEGPALPAAASTAATSKAPPPLSPVNRPRLVIFHAGVDSAQLARQLAAALAAKGYPEPRIGSSDETLTRASNIRYFNAADREAARTLRADIRDFLTATLPDSSQAVQLKNLSRRYPRPERGLLEVWLNTGSSTAAGTRAEMLQARTVEPVLERVTQTTAAAVPEKPTEADIRAFIDDYCRTYETRDPDRLAALFDPTATENGRPFKDLLPSYRANMTHLELLSYRIEVDRWETHPESTTLTVEGRFTAQGLMADQKQYRSQGTITLDVVPHGTSFRVVRLDYEVEKKKSD